MSAARGVVVSAQIGDDPVSRARRVAPLIEAAATRIEQDRALPPDLLETLYENRIIRTLLPRVVGGDETTPETYVRMMTILAAADASAAWCIGQASGCSMSAAYMDLDAARTIWAPREASFAWGVILPNQTARVTEGGYIVNGRWGFASGGRHATWIGGHCKVNEADGTARLDPDGTPTDRTMMFRRDQVSMVVDWNVMGLRGTGSDTYSVKDLFVPAALTVRRDRDDERRPHGRGPLYRFTTTHMYASGFAGVALGIARGLLDAFIALATKKTPQATARRLADSPALQSGLAQAEGQWRAARAGLLMTLRECWATAEQGDDLSNDQKVAIRLASTYAIHQAKAVADFAYLEAGATAIFEGGPFERRFRDLHAVTQQVQARRNHFETVGQHLFGLEPNPRFL